MTEPKRFTSSPPPPGAGEVTLGNLVRGLAHCDHPAEAQSTAVILEPNGSRAKIRWCGACGAIDLRAQGSGDWVRPGVAHVLGEKDRLGALLREIDLRVDRMKELAKTAGAACSRLSVSESAGAELATALRAVEAGCDEIEFFVHGALG